MPIRQQVGKKFKLIRHQLIHDINKEMDYSVVSSRSTNDEGRSVMTKPGEKLFS